MNESALCRAKADWLIGINATRLFSVLYHKTLTVGRVQTPTLKMLALPLVRGDGQPPALRDDGQILIAPLPETLVVHPGVGKGHQMPGQGRLADRH